MRVVCGWCGHPTPANLCEYCGHNPAVPWIQRGQAVPAADHDGSQGRPALDPIESRRQYDAAVSALLAEGRTATVESIADRLGISPRTLRTWKQRFDL